MNQSCSVLPHRSASAGIWRVVARKNVRARLGPFIYMTWSKAVLFGRPERRNGERPKHVYHKVSFHTTKSFTRAADSPNQDLVLLLLPYNIVQLLEFVAFNCFSTFVKVMRFTLYVCNLQTAALHINIRNDT